MPQDTPRSRFYRSFVTCDDPSGVVQCKTIKRSKNGSQRMEGDVIVQKSSTTKKVSSKELIDELGRSSSVQLREVSKGVQKLSKVVDSLPKGRFDRQSEDVAKDLLREALSLQESLQMLGKLQEEVPKYRTHSKEKQKEKAKNDRNIFQRSYSERFGDRNDIMQFQKSRRSVDGSSGDCYEELREVIKESFARQNILPKSFTREKVFSDRKLDFSTDIASASSSQSSMFNSNSNDFASSDSSISNLQSEKPKSSNLIAKLMGLEEIPLKQSENSRLLNIRRPNFDIDLLDNGKGSFIFEKEKPEKRTLGEIIDIMQYKGLIKNKSSNGSSQRKMHHYDVSDIADDTHPVVLIRPREKELLCINKCPCRRKASDANKMLEVWKFNEGVPLKKIEPRERFRNSAEMSSKARADKSAAKRFGKEKEKESKFQVSVPVSSDLQKGEAVEKGVVKIQKVAPSMRKSAGKNQITEPNLKTSIVSKPNNLSKINSTEIRNSRGSIVSKNQVAVQKSPESRRAKILSNSVSQKKKPSSVVVENQHAHVDEEIIVKFDNKDQMVEMRITPSEPLSREEVIDASDHCKIGKALPLLIADYSSTSPESTTTMIEQNCDVICKGSDMFGNQNRMTRANDIRNILLSSVNFCNHAEELFNTTSVQHTMFERTADAKLILDCANELLECKCQQWGITLHPLLQHPSTRPKISISFDYLVVKICDGIENLRNFSKLSDETRVVDSLNAVLKRELRCKGVVTGAWDSGWLNGFSLDDVEQVVFDIQELFLTRIIDDLLLDFAIK